MSLPDKVITSETRHVVPTSIFTLEYALQRYEPLSVTAEYRPSVRRQIELYGGIQNGQTIIDLGCGTGNSTVEIAQSNANFGEIHGIDPSPAIEVARYKFGQIDPQAWKIMTEGISYPPSVQDKIDKEREITAPYAGRVHFHKGGAQNLGLLLPDVSADGAFSVQAVHWMAFAPEDIEGKDINYLTQSFKQIRKRLRDGGVFVFDESGVQFDHGDSTFDGKTLNELHPVNHPFHIAFIANLNQELREMGIIEKPIDPKKIDRYHGMFDLPTLRRLLEESGFELIPTPEGNLYEVEVFYKDAEALQSFIKNGGAMRYFGSPELQALSDIVKSGLIDKALAATLLQHKALLEEPTAETLAFFKARAV